MSDKLQYIKENLDECILMGLLSVATFLVFLQIVMRYVFMDPLSWSEEMARYIYIWQTWIATSYAVRKRRHLRITSAVDLIKGRSRTLLEIFVMVVWAAFTVFLCFKAATLCRMIYTGGQISPALSIPMWIPYAAIPVGSALMTVRLIQQIVADIKALPVSGQAATK